MQFILTKYYLILETLLLNEEKPEWLSRCGNQTTSYRTKELFPTSCRLKEIFFYPKFSFGSVVRPVRKSSLYRGARWLGRKTYHVTLHSAEAKNVCTYVPHSQIISGQGAKLYRRTISSYISLFHRAFWFIKFYSHKLVHFFIHLCISLLSYIKIT